MPILSVVVATVALIDGATLTFDCRRIEPRITREELETSGEITRPVERVVQEGRVDVTVTRRILGLILIQRLEFNNVTDVDSFSGTTHVPTSSTSRVTRSYDSGDVSLTTRHGTKWESPTIARSFRPGPGEIRDRIDAFLTAASPDTLKLRVVPWFSNLIGVPFVFVALMFVRLWFRRIVGRFTGEAPPQL